MQRFICAQNIAHFQKLLDTTSEPGLRHTLQSLLKSARRDLAIFEAAKTGASETETDWRRHHDDAQGILRQFRPDFEASLRPYMLLDPGPGLRIVDINDAYAQVTFTTRTGIVGRLLFEVFPDNPDDAFADGVSNLYASLRVVVKTGQPHAMAIQRYDMRDLQGQFVERHWQLINSPIHDRGGHLLYILHHVEDVTAQTIQATMLSRAS